MFFPTNNYPTSPQYYFEAKDKKPFHSKHRIDVIISSISSTKKTLIILGQGIASKASRQDGNVMHFWGRSTTKIH